ncbi:MAG: glycosyltransferase family 2 protein [Flavobacteriales bacterium]
MSTGPLPRISLITPSFQQAGYLEECLASVHEQGYPQLEHIVVDGGSTDGSVGIIQRYADRINWWCSEPDQGQSAAINKGLAHATGQVFGWLNSDDLLLPGALEAVAEVFASDPNAMVVTGARIRRGSHGQDDVLPADPVDDLKAWYVRPMVNQQSTFYRMEAIQAIGGVEERLHFVMDYELWEQVIHRFGPSAVRIVPRPLSVFRIQAASKTSTAQHRFLDETASVLHGLSLQVARRDLADVLASGYAITQGLRRFQSPLNNALVQDMVVQFLLKWDHTIFTRDQFRRMRLFRRTIELDRGLLTPLQSQWLDEVDEQLRMPGWLAFRSFRKWKHLVR